MATGSIALRLDDDDALRRAPWTWCAPPSAACRWRWPRGGWRRCGARVAAGGPRSSCWPARWPTPGRGRAARRPARRPGGPVPGRGDRDGEAVALALGSLAADARDDVDHLVSLAQQARSLAAGDDNPRLALLVAGVDAAVLAIEGGDFDAALALLDRPVAGLSPAERPAALVRLHWHFLILAGRAGEAAALMAGVGPAPGLASPGGVRGVARWLDGEPAGLLGGGRHRARPLPGPERAGHLRPRGVRRRHRRLRPRPRAGAPGGGRPRRLDGHRHRRCGRAKAAATCACQAVVDGDDGRAAALVADSSTPDRSRASPRPTCAAARPCPTCARRPCAAGGTRATWARQRRSWAAARLLVDARAGRAGHAAVPLDVVITTLPPGTVELAARPCRAPWGVDLAVRLADLFGDDVMRRLHERLDDPDDRVRRGAAAVIRALPARPAALRIRVLGPLDGRRAPGRRPRDPPHPGPGAAQPAGGGAHGQPRPGHRRPVADPRPGPGQANLRVTLRHLHGCWSPTEGQGAAPYFRAGRRPAAPAGGRARPGGGRLGGHRPAGSAEADRRRGDVAGRVDHLRSAVALWRGAGPSPTWNGSAN